MRVAQTSRDPIDLPTVISAAEENGRMALFYGEIIY